MAGTNIRVEVETATALQSVTGIAQTLDDPKPMLAEIREYLMRIHRQRFKDQKAPDGTPWHALSPRYLKRKHRNQNKILTLRGYLQGSLRGQIDDEGLLFGTNVVYAAIHQLGGLIKHAGRTASVFFKRRGDGSVGNRFVKKKNSDFAQDVNIAEHETRMPARPFLGTSNADNDHIVGIALRHLQKPLN